MSTKQPSRLRLLASMKGLLRENAETHIYPHGLKEAYDAAYEAAKPLVKAAVLAKYKKADMDVLVRYDCASTVFGAKLHYTDGTVTRFDWRLDEPQEELPRVPNAFEYKNGIYQADAATAKVVDKWLAAKEAFDKEYQARRRAYDALINGATYLEDLLEVWPEAAQIVPRTQGALIALGPEQIAAVKRDLEEQRKRAARSKHA